MKMKRLPSIIGTIGLGAWLSAPCFSATYYVSTAGGDANSCGAAQTAATAKATFASAWSCLSAGDSMIVRDGIYNQDLTPPQGKAGAAGNVITVKAETFGSAIINGKAILINNSYLTFQGLKMVGPSNDSVFDIDSNGSAATASHHITLQQMGLDCPLTGATVNNNACAGISAGAHDNLVEDSWIWGGGRYTMLLYGRDGSGGTSVTGADLNTLRRVVIRMGPDQSGSGEPQAGLGLYYASSNTIENVLVLDSNANSDTSNSAFYLTSHATPPNVSDNRYFGLIALNTSGNGAVGLYLDVDGGGNSSRTQVTDSVFWANSGDGMSFYNANAGNSVNTAVNHVTAGKSGANGYSNYTNGTSVKNSIITNNQAFGFTNGSAGSTLEDYNDVFSNASGDRNNVPAGSHSISANPQLLYLPRIETTSPCHGTGEGGSDCGADVTKEYMNGIKTATNLWPWPNEDRIKKEMCADSGITSGFCGAQTLTKYIWEYNGNSIPPEIYGGGGGGGGTAPSIIQQPQNQTAAAGASVTFSLVATGSPTLSYQWYKNGTAINGATGASTTFAAQTADNGALFFGRVINPFGNVSSSSATLTVSGLSGTNGINRPRKLVFNPLHGEKGELICLPQGGEASATVYNRDGLPVVEIKRTLGGSECLTWNGRNGGDEIVAAGLYFYIANGDDQKIKDKLLVTK